MVVPAIGIAIAPVSASADQVSDKRALAAALAQKINSQGQQVELLAEQFNGAQLHQTQVQQQVADAQQRFDAARARAELNRVALNQEAVTAYVHGGMVARPGLVGYRGAANIAVAKGYFDVATSSQVDALDRMRQAEHQLRQQQATLLTAVHDAQVAVALVASRRQAVEQAANASAATLNQVQGDLVTLVADQQAAISSQQQAQAKAAFDAAQARQQRQQTVVAQAGAATTGTAARSALGPAPAGTAAAPGSANPVQDIVAGVTPPPTKAPPTTVKPAPVPAPVPVKASAGAATAIAYAQAQLGKPYLWGGAGPDSFDCSGLTMRAWGAAGVSLPHSAASQYANTAHIPIADLQPGDLVFFGSDLHHEGLYVGNGTMIHAAHSGTVISYSGIFWPDLQPFGGRP